MGLLRWLGLAPFKQGVPGSSPGRLTSFFKAFDLAGAPRGDLRAFGAARLRGRAAELYELARLLRRLKAALDAEGLWTTARAVLERIGR